MPQIIDKLYYAIFILLCGLVFAFYSLTLQNKYSLILALCLTFLNAFFFALLSKNKVGPILYFHNRWLIYAISALCILSLAIPEISNTVMVDFKAISTISWIRIFSAFALTTILPGAYVVRILDTKNEIELTSKLAIGYSISVAFSIIFTRFGTLYSSDFKQVLLGYVAFIILLALSSFIIDLIIQKKEERTHEIVVIDCVIITFIIFFVFVAWASLNPINLYNWDSERLRSGAMAILKGVTFESEGYYWSSWLQNHFALTNGLSGIPPVNFHFCYIIIYIFYVIAYFSMVRSFFCQERRSTVPILATLFFTMFSGYGWLNAFLKRFLFNQSWVEALYIGGAETNFDVIFSALPREEFSRLAGLTGIFSYISLLELKKLKELQKIPLYILIMLSMLVYIPALFMLFAFILTLIFINVRNRRKYFAGFASYTISVCLIIFLDAGSWGNMMIMRAYTILMIISIALCIMTLKPTNFESKIIYFFKKILSKHSQKLLIILTSLLIYLYGLSFIVWLHLKDTVNFAELVYGSGLVPWYSYPLLIGVLGTIALVLFIRTLLNGNKINYGETYFAALSLVLLASAKSIALLKDIGVTIYYERRFIPLIIGAIAVVAASELLRFKICKVRQVTALTMIFILGVSSTAFQADLNSITTNYQWAKLSGEKIQLANFLWKEGSAYESVLVISPYNSLLHPDEGSYTIEYYSGMKTYNMYGEGSAILGNGLTSIQYLLDIITKWNVKYIYFHKDIFNNLAEVYPQDCLLRFIATHFRATFSNNEGIIFGVPELYAPSDNACVRLIVPAEKANDFTYAYPIFALALSGISYSIAYESKGMFSSWSKNSTIILSHDPIEVSDIWKKEVFDWVKTGGHLLVINTEGKGFLRNLFIETEETLKTAYSDCVGNHEEFIHFPSIKTLIESPKPGVHTILYYMSGNSKITPFLSLYKEENGSIAYMNLFYYLNSILTSKEYKTQYFLKLGEIMRVALEFLSFVKFPLKQFNPISPIAKILVSGDINLKNATISISDIITPNNELYVGEIRITPLEEDGSSKTYNNFSIISLSVNGSTMVYADDISIRPYRDNYVAVVSPLKSISFKVSGGTALKLVGFERGNNQTLVYEFLRNVKVKFTEVRSQSDALFSIKLLKNSKPIHLWSDPGCLSRVEVVNGSLRIELINLEGGMKRVAFSIPSPKVSTNDYSGIVWSGCLPYNKSSLVVGIFWTDGSSNWARVDGPGPFERVMTFPRDKELEEIQFFLMSNETLACTTFAIIEKIDLINRIGRLSKGCLLMGGFHLNNAELAVFKNATFLGIKKAISWNRLNINKAKFSLVASNLDLMRVDLFEGQIKKIAEDELKTTSEIFNYELSLPWCTILTSLPHLVFSAVVIFTIANMWVRRSKIKLKG